MFAIVPCSARPTTAVRTPPVAASEIGSKPSWCRTPKTIKATTTACAKSRKTDGYGITAEGEVEDDQAREPHEAHHEAQHRQEAEDAGRAPARSRAADEPRTDSEDQRGDEEPRRHVRPDRASGARNRRNSPSTMKAARTPAVPRHDVPPSRARHSRSIASDIGGGQYHHRFGPVEAVARRPRGG